MELQNKTTPPSALMAATSPDKGRYPLACMASSDKGEVSVGVNDLPLRREVPSEREAEGENEGGCFFVEGFCFPHKSLKS